MHNLLLLHNRRLRCLLLLAAAAFNPLCARHAAAALGGDANSVLTDANALHGATHSTPLLQYTLHQIDNDGGMRVREFVNRNGIVFAVAWSGPVVPDLQSLLGPSFATYSRALAALQQTGLHRSLQLAADGLIIELGGHMRAYSGRAYLPALLPPGTPTADLR